MGKSIVIKGADFSAVAVGKDTITSQYPFTRMGTNNKLEQGYYGITMGIPVSGGNANFRILIDPSVIPNGAVFKYAYLYYNLEEVNPDGTVGSSLSVANYEGVVSTVNESNKSYLLIQITVVDSGNNPLGGIFDAVGTSTAVFEVRI